MKSAFWKLGICCFAAVVNIACQNKEVEQASDVTNTGLTVSGIISVSNGSAVDSDVNDINAKYTANDSLASAQAIHNNTTLSGYINLAGAGPQGRSFLEGDQDDYFSSYLLANQTISLSLDNNALGQRIIDIHLLDEQGNILQSANNVGSSASLSNIEEGKRYIQVHARTGAASYILSIADNNNTAGAISNASALPPSATTNADFVPGEVIVTFKAIANVLAKSTSLQQRANSIGLQAKAGEPGRSMLFTLGDSSRRLKAFHALGATRTPSQAITPLEQNRQDTIDMVNALRKHPDVASARLNFIRYPTAIPNDSFYSEQWHYQTIKLPQAWDVTTGSDTVTVAVIDTGILGNHPDLQGKIIAGYDFIRDVGNAGDGDGIDDDATDEGDGGAGASSFHGTHVAGTIGASTNNTTGVAGIGWDINIMPLRVLGEAGGNDYDIEQAVRFAAGLANDSGTVPQQTADVINLSLGGPTIDTQAPEAFRLARDAGVIIVAAAGNESSSDFNYPASIEGVISVSAVDFNKQITGYSNFGTSIDIAAPGGDISADLNSDGFVDGVLSTWADDSNAQIEYRYAFFEGTSMAAPHVAAVIALMRSVYPQLNPGEFDQLLQAGTLTEDLGVSGRDNLYGHGLIDAAAAVTVALDLNTNSQPGDAEVVVSPERLNFGHDLTSLRLLIGRQGSGLLNIANISSTANWITVTANQVDNNGLGSYTVSIDRSGLSQDTFTASINIATIDDSVIIPVAMQVLAASSLNNTGKLSINLVRTEDGSVAKTLQLDSVNGSYIYSFSNVSAGIYMLVASSDNNNNGDGCAYAEACALYPLISGPQSISVQSNNINGVDFTIGYTQNSD